jgi:hypothetical protein
MDSLSHATASRLERADGSSIFIPGNLSIGRGSASGLPLTKAERQYAAMPKATISPDGKLVIFSSNMNDSDGRVDVFAAEVPLP